MDLPKQDVVVGLLGKIQELAEGIVAGNLTQPQVQFHFKEMENMVRTAQSQPAGVKTASATMLGSEMGAIPEQRQEEGAQGREGKESEKEQP